MGVLNDFFDAFDTGMFDYLDTGGYADAFTGIDPTGFSDYANFDYDYYDTAQYDNLGFDYASGGSGFVDDYNPAPMQPNLVADNSDQAWIDYENTNAPANPWDTWNQQIDDAGGASEEQLAQGVAEYQANNYSFPKLPMPGLPSSYGGGGTSNAPVQSQQPASLPGASTPLQIPRATLPAATPSSPGWTPTRAEIDAAATLIARTAGSGSVLPGGSVYTNGMISPAALQAARQMVAAQNAKSGTLTDLIDKVGATVQANPGISIAVAIGAFALLTMNRSNNHGA